LTRTSSNPKIKKTVTFNLDTIKEDTKPNICKQNRVSCKCSIF
jgi:hypothetical protein